MKSRRNVRLVVALVGIVLLAGAGWFAAGQIKSPAQIAVDTAAPRASLVTAQVQRRSLSTEVIVRGTGRYGKPQAVSLPSSSLKTSTQVVSRVPKPDQVLRERSIALTVSGRPVFVLQGATPMHRDVGPGDSGEDVRQLERALSRFGYGPGAVDGRYDTSTAAAVAQMYSASDAAPFGVTETQIDKLNTAAALVATTTDFLLQQRLALRTAKRGATRGEVNQARLDAGAVAELIPPVRASIAAASTKAAEAQDLASIAQRLESEGDGPARRDVAGAQVDVTTKQSALNDAVVAQAEAQRAVDAVPADAPPSEVEAARSTLRIATAKIPNLTAELEAARATQQAAEAALGQSSRKASDDGRKAARDLALARSELREGQRTLGTLTNRRRLALARVRILRRPVSTSVERDVVAAASREAARAKTELARLASRSGVQVPADEVLFFANTPVRVDTVTATRGSQVSGDLLTVSNTTLAIDSGLSPQDAKLVRSGQRVRIEDAETGIDLRGRVTRIADRPGTNPQLADPTKTAFEVTPEGADNRLVNTSVRITIAIESTKGKVLTVPLNALSVGANGKSRVQVDAGGGTTRVVLVTPGLAAAGNVEVEPQPPGALRAGDRVVIGTGSPSAAVKAPTGSSTPPTPPGVSTTPGGGRQSSSSSSGSAPATTTPAGPATTTPTTGGAATTPAPGGATTPPAAVAPTDTTGAQGATRGP